MQDRGTSVKNGKIFLNVVSFFSFLISFRDKPSWLCFPIHPIHLSLTLFTLKRNVSVYSLFKTDHLVMDLGIGNYITIPKTKQISPRTGKCFNCNQANEVFILTF